MRANKLAEEAESSEPTELEPPPPLPPEPRSTAPALAEKAERVQAQIEHGQIRGVSESTMHAVLEEIRELRSQLKRPPEDPPAPKKSIWPF